MSLMDYLRGLPSAEWAILRRRPEDPAGVLWQELRVGVATVEEARDEVRSPVPPLGPGDLVRLWSLRAVEHWYWPLDGGHAVRLPAPGPAPWAATSSAGEESPVRLPDPTGDWSGFWHESTNGPWLLSFLAAVSDRVPPARLIGWAHAALGALLARVPASTPDAEIAVERWRQVGLWVERGRRLDFAPTFATAQGLTPSTPAAKRAEALSQLRSAVAWAEQVPPGTTEVLRACYRVGFWTLGATPEADWTQARAAQADLVRAHFPLGAVLEWIAEGERAKDPGR